MRISVNWLAILIACIVSAGVGAVATALMLSQRQGQAFFFDELLLLDREANNSVSVSVEMLRSKGDVTMDPDTVGHRPVGFTFSTISDAAKRAGYLPADGPNAECMAGAAGSQEYGRRDAKSNLEFGIEIFHDDQCIVTSIAGTVHAGP